MYNGSSPMGAACARCPARMQSRPPSERPLGTFCASAARNRTFPMKALPSTLNSSKTASSAVSSNSRNRSKAGFPRFRYPQKPMGTLQARCAVVAPYFIWKDAVPVGAASTQLILTSFCLPAVITAWAPPRVWVLRSRCARTSARTVVDFPEPAAPERISLRGLRGAREKRPRVSQSCRATALCATTS